jgi:hypothetical protein
MKKQENINIMRAKDDIKVVIILRVNHLLQYLKSNLEELCYFITFLTLTIFIFCYGGRGKFRLR